MTHRNLNCDLLLIQGGADNAPTLSCTRPSDVGLDQHYGVVELKVLVKFG
jgi:hypothetical protein